MGSSPVEHLNLSILASLGGATELYVGGKIDAVDFKKMVSEFMDEEVTFRCSYASSVQKLKPLFQERVGIQGILERYEYENKHQEIHPSPGDPAKGNVRDFAAHGNVVYYSQTETASFFNGPNVTFEVVTRMIIESGKIREIYMFLDGQAIEAAYASS